MADEVIVEHAGGHEMSGAAGWFLLLVTIVLGVIIGILVLAVVNEILEGEDKTK